MSLLNLPARRIRFFGALVLTGVLILLSYGAAKTNLVALELVHKTLLMNTSPHALEDVAHLHTQDMWQSARLNLLQNNAQEGLSSLPNISQVNVEIEHDPIKFQWAVLTYGKLDLYPEIAGLYTTHQPISMTNVVRDVVALALLNENQFAEVIKIRPHDLTANYLLWRTAQTSENESQMKATKDRIAFFDKSVVNISSEKLAEMQIKTAQILLNSGLWTETTYNQFISLYKNDDADDSSCGVQSGATITPNQNIVGNMLLPTEHLRSDGWVWRWNNSDEMLSTYTTVQSHSNKPIFRLDNFWRRKSLDAGAWYSEVAIHKLNLKANQKYLVSICYKTDYLHEGNAFVALIDYVPNPRYTALNTSLPSTSGLWQRWEATVTSGPADVPLDLVLRNWATGRVSFSNVALQEIA